MKKIIVGLLTIFLITVSANAQSVVLGAKGMFSMNLGTTYEQNFKIPNNYLDKVLLGGGGSIFGRYNLPLNLPKKHKLGIQLELVVSANNGKKIIGETIQDNGMQQVYTSIDIPLLITYRIPFEVLGLTLGVGPNFSIPLGKIRQQGFGIFNNSSYNESVELDHFIMGMAASISLDYNVGPGNVLLEARYLNDFMPATIRTVSKTDVVHHTKIMTRRALQLSVGFAVSF